ncbi:sialic acid TRAP transporter small permease protein SiaQ [Alkalibacillus haloalkaliphilus]|uniref:Sialic acid TRAP transporter small permease protein SiaQ n=1 Tax=Alkalibacillus haloalkaliphilus TaxID=94136 RepID=A0A511W6B9_9BACI|nr:sialic acid TRAP transporter small permease protein SiaQ [Alkalibacillus haloalkaliphilus]
MLIITFLVLVAQVFSRTILDSPLTWSEQLARFLFVYVAYLAVSSEIKDDGHVRIDYFYNKFPRKVKVWLHYFFQTCISIVLLLIIYVGVIISIRRIPVEIVSLNISYVYMFMALPLLGTLMLYRLIEREVKRVKNNEGVE